MTKKTKRRKARKSGRKSSRKPEASASSSAGILVTFEGTEGAGKSTLADEVAARLHEYGYRAILTREPGGSRVAEQIRRIILDEKMDTRAELFLYEAARAEHLAQVIRPALERGDVVLCDRFTDSTLAYQSMGRGLPWPEVKALNGIATQGLKPDLTVLVDIDPAKGLKRARERTRFEAEGLEFHKKVRQGFLKARQEESRRWMTVKALSGSPGELAEAVIAMLLKRFKARIHPRVHG